MIRFSLFLAFFAVVFSLSAQNAESVFVDKNFLEWYDKEIKTLDESIAAINKGESYVSARTQLKKSLRIINTNCLSLFEKMSRDLDEEKLAPLRETPVTESVHTNALDRKNARLRQHNSDRFDELRMTQADVEAFLDNLSKFKNLDDELQHNKYNFRETVNRSWANQLEQLSSLAHKNNQLLKSKYN